MKTVIEMASEAGLYRQQHNLMSNPVQHRFSYDGYEENLERFVDLVRADAIADEREACATVCDGLRVEYEEGKNMAVVCAAAIRARSNT